MTMNKLKPFLAALMICVLAFTASVPFASAKNYGEYTSDDPEVVDLRNQKDQLNAQIEESKKQQQVLQKEIDETSEKANAIQKQIDVVQAEVDAYNKKIAIINSQVNALNAQISKITNDIDESEQKIKEQEEQIKETQKVLGQRLRAMYMAGNVSSVELILEADSFENLLARLELVAQITRHDNAIIEGLKGDIEELNKTKQILEEKKVQLEENKKEIEAGKQEVVAAKNEVAAKRAELGAKKSVLTTYLRSLSADNKELRAYEANLKAKQDAYQAQIDAMINGIASNGNGTVSGGMVWPVSPSSGSYISSGYGYRTMGGESSSFHGGIDIARSGASNGNTSIVAAANGKVIRADKDCTHNYPKSYRYEDPHYSSYGNCVYIDHGNGVVTVYGHMSYVSVSTGQTVSAGQTIGTMGCTGYSTGFHLHFEVRVNGSKVNPSNYVSKP